jgi:hypothetical protein
MKRINDNGRLWPRVYIVIVQEMRREFYPETLLARKCKERSPNARQSRRLQSHATQNKVYHTDPRDKQTSRKGEFFPGPTTSRNRVRIPIVIVTYDIWYREKKKKMRKGGRRE